MRSLTVTLPDDRFEARAAKGDYASESDVVCDSLEPHLDDDSEFAEREIAETRGAAPKRRPVHRSACRSMTSWSGFAGERWAKTDEIDRDRPLAPLGTASHIDLSRDPSHVGQARADESSRI